MKKSLIVLTQCLVLLSALSAQAALPEYDPSRETPFSLDNWLFKDGDDPRWASSDYDDSAWEFVSKEKFYPDTRGLHWLRTTFIISREQRAYPVILRLGRIQSAFEVYCNGVFVGRNGMVGLSREQERPGRLFMAVLLDRHLKTGRNVISVRLSDFRYFPPGFFFYARLDSRLNPNYYDVGFLLRHAFCIGIMFSGVIIGLMIFLAGGAYRNFFFYFLICLAFFISSGFRFIMHVANISLEMLGVFEPVFIGGYYLAEISIVLFLLFTFKLRYKRYHVIAIALVSAVFYLVSLRGTSIAWLQLNTYYILLIPYILTLIVFAIVKKKKGSVIALFGYIVYALLRSDVLPFSLFSLIPSGYLYQPLFIVSFAMVANRQVLEQQQVKKSTELRAQRLESQLLKKAIQPHFLMNTLASLQSLSRREPDKAEQMIQAIADEYRRINEIMPKSMIPIEEELNLCRSHLQLMGFRREAHYELTVESICPGSLVPPLIFHTLVENGLTHALKPKEDGLFVFNCRREETRTVYSLANNGSLLAARANRGEADVMEGTGIKYVKSRLEETFPGRWGMQYALVGGMWRVVIIIKDR